MSEPEANNPPPAATAAPDPVAPAAAAMAGSPAAPAPAALAAPGAPAPAMAASAAPATPGGPAVVAGASATPGGISPRLQPAEVVRKSVLIALGALVYALGLRLFILPNGLFDNGTTGISVLVFYGFKFNLSLVFLVLNFPFWVIGYRNISKSYGLYTVLAVVLLSAFTSVLDLINPIMPLAITHDILISSIFGGLFLGLGVGIIIKSGGSLDGVETTAILLARRTGMTIGELALSMNVIIMLSAGLMFGLDKFFYSLISYFVSSKLIDLTIEGFNSAKNVFVISELSAEISEHLITHMNKGITYISAKGGYSKKEKNVIMLICTRFELQKIKTAILSIDPRAFLVINDVHEVTNGRFKRI